MVEYPIFVQSEFFAAIQLADLCAYNIFRALQLKFGQPFLAAKAQGQAEYMQPIKHQAFDDPAFLNELFLQRDVDLPALARLLERRGRIIKLP